MESFEMVVSKYGNQELAQNYELHFKRANGEVVTKVVKNPQTALALTAVDSLTEVLRAGDVRLSILFAKLERENVFKLVEVKNMGEMIQAQWGFAKSTALSYLNIGKTFFNKDGVEVIEGISNFSLGQLLPFVALVNDYPCIEGVDMDNTFMARLIKWGLISPKMSVKELNGIATILKMSYLPKEWIELRVDGENSFYCIKNDSEGVYSWLTDPRFTEVAKGDGKGDTKGDGKGDNTSVVMDNKESLVALLTAFSEYEMDEKTRKKWETATKSILDIVANFPE